MAVYLDTNAFDHLYRKVGCTAADIANLRKKIYGRELSLILSIHTLEEILLDRNARPEARVARVKLTLSLANFRRMVKPCNQLLTDDIRSYARTGEAARPFIDAGLQNVMSDGLSELIETDGEELDEDMMAALEEVRGGKSLFRGSELSASGEAAVGDTPFAAYFAARAPAAARELARRAGILDQVERRSLNGLLTLPSVRTAVVLQSWTEYRQNAANSSIDDVSTIHAICASASAKSLVTGDQRLSDELQEVGSEGLEIIALPSFLQGVA